MKTHNLSIVIILLICYCKSYSQAVPIILKGSIGIPDDTISIIVNVAPASQNTLELVDNLLHIVGAKYDKVLVYESSQVSVAMVGIKHNQEVLIINPSIINEKQSDCANNAILAHELGHIFARHLTEKSTKQHELEADYYAGFLGRRINCSVKELSKPFQSFIVDNVHPSFNERKLKISEGWNDANGISLFNINDDRKLPIDFFILVTPNIKTEERPDLIYKVFLSVTSTDKFFTQEELHKRVIKVKYTLHGSMRENKIPSLFPIISLFPVSVVYNRNEKNVNFRHVINVWGKFPIKATIYFEDGTKKVIKKSFNLT